MSPVDAALLAAGIGVPGRGAVGFVRPVSLDHPLRAVGECQRLSSECPRAFVGVLTATVVVPSVETRICSCFRKFMPRNIRQCCQPFITRHRRLRIASSIAIELVEERKLHSYATARAGTMPGAVIARSPRSEEHTSELQSRGLTSYAVFC